MKQKQTVRINESQLRGIIKESVKNILNEYEKLIGVDFETTLNWVKWAKPNMSQQEQEKFAWYLITKHTLRNRKRWE